MKPRRDATYRLLASTPWEELERPVYHGGRWIDPATLVTAHLPKTKEQLALEDLDFLAPLENRDKSVGHRLRSEESDDWDYLPSLWGDRAEDAP